jgi:hypothetical protein
MHHSCSSDSAIRVYKPDHTDRSLHRTVPTKDQILVPETLLKKRKSQEKAREQRLTTVEKRKKVSQIPHTYPHIFGDDTYQQSD